MKTINDIFEMLDLFYAIIHLYNKMRKENEHEDKRSKPKYQNTCRAE